MHCYIEYVLYIFTALINSQYSAPPKFTHSESKVPQDVEIPSNLIIKGNYSRTNTLVCAAINANNIEWQYYETREGLKTNFPAGMKQKDQGIDEVNKQISRVITDQWSTHDKRLLNGYYKCTASNIHGYEIQSPPIRLIVPGRYLQLTNY